VIGGSYGWNTAKTLGNTSVRARTSNFTFSSKERNCPYANTAGVASRKKTVTGERDYGEF